MRKTGTEAAVQTIAAVVGWQEAFSASKSTPQDFSSPTPATYFAVEPTRSPGTYHVGGNLILLGTASNTQVQAEFFVDGVNLGPLLQPSGMVNGNFLLTASSDRYHAGGPFTLEYKVALFAGTGLVRALAAEFNLVKVEDSDIT